MCECGCVGNWRRYKFPGPGDSFYILVLAPHCLNCDAPSGVFLDHIKPGHTLYADYKRGDFTDGNLEWFDGPDNPTATVVTGMLRHEFIKALTAHFTEMDVEGLLEDGAFDECSADVILEEMYDDAQFAPKLA